MRFGDRLGSPAVTIPAAASIAVADLASGRRRSARVLGQFPTAIYLDAGPKTAVAIVRSDGVRLPNAIVVRAKDWPDRPANGEVTVGERELTSRHWRIRVARWWDPRPRLEPVAAGTLAGRLAALGHPMPRHGSQVVGLGEEVVRLQQAAERLVGRGAGLTPAGDDVLAGLLATLRLVRVADADRERIDRFAERLGERVLELAGDRTPTLSASLLSHATRGEVAQPMAELLRTLTHRGGDGASLAGAAARLAEVGHSSGRDLLTGVRVGAGALLGADARGSP